MTWLVSSFYSVSVGFLAAKNVFLYVKRETSPAVSKLPSEGGTEEILSTRDGGAMGTMVGTPVTKYGG